MNLLDHLPVPLSQVNAVSLEMYVGIEGLHTVGGSRIASEERSRLWGIISVRQSVLLWCSDAHCNCYNIMYTESVVHIDSCRSSSIQFMPVFGDLSLYLLIQIQPYIPVSTLCYVLVCFLATKLQLRCCVVGDFHSSSSLSRAPWWPARRNSGWDQAGQSPIFASWYALWVPSLGGKLPETKSQVSPKLQNNSTWTANSARVSIQDFTCRRLEKNGILYVLW